VLGKIACEPQRCCQEELGRTIGMCVKIERTKRKEFGNLRRAQEKGWHGIKVRRARFACRFLSGPPLYAGKWGRFGKRGKRRRHTRKEKGGFACGSGREKGSLCKRIIRQKRVSSLAKTKELKGG